MFYMLNEHCKNINKMIHNHNNIVIYLIKKYIHEKRQPEENHQTV